MSISQPRLKIREDPITNSSTLWTCPTPQNIRTGNPMIWFKKQGKSFNYIEFVVDLMDADDNGATNLYVTPTLLYANHTTVMHQNILNLLNDATVRIDENTKMIRIDGQTKQATFRFRIEEVSSRHLKQLFCIKVSASRASGQPALEICPDISTFIEVRSKPSEAQSPNSASVTNILLPGDTSSVKSPSITGNIQHHTPAISNLINWDNFLLESVNRLRAINTQRGANSEDVSQFLDLLSSGYNNHNVRPNLMYLQEQIVTTQSQFQTQSQFSATQGQYHQIISPSATATVPQSPLPSIDDNDSDNDSDSDSSLRKFIIEDYDNDNKVISTEQPVVITTINTESEGLHNDHHFHNDHYSLPSPSFSDFDINEFDREFLCNSDSRQTTQELSDGRPYKRNTHNEFLGDEMLSMLAEPLTAHIVSTMSEWTSNTSNLSSFLIIGFLVFLDFPSSVPLQSSRESFCRRRLKWLDRFKEYQKSPYFSIQLCFRRFYHFSRRLDIPLENISAFMLFQLLP
eukprot:gene4113-8171_t